MLKVVLCLVVLGVLQDTDGHSYHLGTCPNIDPLPGFNMKKVLFLVVVVRTNRMIIFADVGNLVRRPEN